MRLTIPWLVATVALTLLFLAPAIYNHSPFLFPDSVGYSRSGTASLDAVSSMTQPHVGQADGGPGAAKPKPSADRGGDGTSTSRSVYYGIPLALLQRAGGIWAVAVAQVVLTIVVLFAGLRWWGGGSVWRDGAAIAVAGTLGGLSIFTDTLMPDLFAGLMIFGVAVFLGFHRKMTLTERLAWLALIALCVLVHKGHLAVLFALTALAGLIALFARRLEWRAFAGLAIAMVVAWAGHTAVGFMVTKVTGEAPVPTPFLLSRVVGDGTAKPYLDKACASTPYIMCRYRDRFPMTENEFLWSNDPGVGVVGHLNREERRQLAAEGNTIVVGAVLHDPLRQIGVTLANMARQNITIGVTRFGMRNGLEPERGPEMSPALIAYRHSAVFRGAMPLKEISGLMTAVYAIAVIGLAILVARRSRVLFERDDHAAALQLIIAGVLINACVFGAISSTADRYQGRVAWLIPLMLVVLVWPRDSRPQATDEVGLEA